MRIVRLALTALLAASLVACSSTPAQPASTPTSIPTPTATATPTPRPASPTPNATPAVATTPPASTGATATAPYPEVLKTAFVNACVGSQMTTATGCGCLIAYLEAHVPLADYATEQRQTQSSGQASPKSVQWITDAAASCKLS